MQATAQSKSMKVLELQSFLQAKMVEVGEMERNVHALAQGRISELRQELLAELQHE